VSIPVVFNMSQIANDYQVSKSQVHGWIKGLDLRADFQMPTGSLIFLEANVRANVPRLKAQHRYIRKKIKKGDQQ